MSPTAARAGLLLLLVALAAATPAQRVAADGPRISPFRGLRAAEKGLEVQVDDDTWYALESVHGVDVVTLLQESRRLCADLWWKRITEDLPALLDAMGHPVGTRVDLQLRDPTTGSIRELAAVEMTEANRQRLLLANKGAAPPSIELPPATLAAAAVAADLAELQRLIDTRFAYRGLRPVDVAALVAASRQRLGEGDVPRAALAREVDAILRALGDGHSRLADGQLPASDSFLPFLVQAAQGGLVAFRPDRRGLLDPERPFIAAIDGVPIERWLAAARVHATQGSPALLAHEAECLLRELGTLRQDLSLPGNPRVAVTLRGSATGSHQDRELIVDVAARRPLYGSWPRGGTRVLDGNVGYLRLPEMSSDAALLDGIDAAMASFRDTRALIVDVRGNGGGSRDALRRLFPWLLGEGDAPVVVNAAAALLAAHTGTRAPNDGWLADRGLFPVEWKGWTDAQRTAIAQFARGFAPEWKLPVGRFSPWHFLVLDRADNPKADTYSKPVRVLIDGGCFSATDVFVAALRTRPQVRLGGSATGGGSGRARSYRLAQSALALQLSSMASFRPDGKLFDGRGSEPDAPCEPRPQDLVGQGDAVLDAALASLR